MTGGRTLAALAAALLLLPQAGAVATMQEQRITFDTPTTFQMAITIKCTGNEALSIRALFNTDHDRMVTQQEVHDGDALLVANLKPAESPLLDGKQPVNVTFGPSGIEGAVGPVNATTPLVLRLHLTYVYPSSGEHQHVLRLHRAASQQQGPSASFAVTPPPGHYVSAASGFPETVRIAANRSVLSGSLPLVGSEANLTVAFEPLDDSWRGGASPAPVAPLVAVLIVALAGVRRRRAT